MLGQIVRANGKSQFEGFFGGRGRLRKLFVGCESRCQQVESNRILAICMLHGTTSIFNGLC